MSRETHRNTKVAAKFGGRMRETGSSSSVTRVFS
jgi:hypothetical protein